ncbi:MAG: metallophosphoesterase [Xanthobacteraceae bacterium]|nr:metallophosphoesterase [Xanthobacteraceae bacterium]
MFVLAHLSDPHLAPLPRPRPLELLSKRGLGYVNWLRKRRGIHRADVLETLVADLKTRAPDHVAVTGDLVNLSLASEFEPARAWLQKLGGPGDVTVVPGNHDCYVRAAVGSALREWNAYMRGDGGESFPFVRRRGPLALIGLSTSLPTLPFAATGRLHGDQIARLGEVLARLRREAFRVVLIHHPPFAGANYFRRLDDAGALRDVLQEHGAELVLHGHHHEASLHWLSGPQARIPVAGVPSASGAPGHHDDPAGYNLYEIEGAWGAWRCTMIARGWRDSAIAEVSRQALFV